MISRVESLIIVLFVLNCIDDLPSKSTDITIKTIMYQEGLALSSPGKQIEGMLWS